MSREGEVNHVEGWCRRCRGIVPAGQGVYHKRVLVHCGECPEPDEIVRPNRYAGECDMCCGWVDEGEGIAVRQDTSSINGARYNARHDGYCPTNPKPAPPEGGFTGQWTAHSIGLKSDRFNPHPWVRELTRGQYGEQTYRWVRGKKDYSGANIDGSLGIKTSFTLKAGRLYEAECVVERPMRGGVQSRRERMFLHVTDEGDVKMLSEQAREVQAWLTMG